MRIKALPLSQSKQEKRTEGVITIQRGKDSWNQRPQTSGSLTPPLTRAPRTRARLHAHYHRPTPPLQRTTATHAPFCSAPTAIVAGNMQNFDLLKEVGKVDVPVILKRGMSATISEWLMAAEYVAAGGNHRIMLCERGIRTFETAYRNVLDVTAVAVLKKETHLPVIVDPSHAGGKAWMVPALSCAAVAAGADALLIEVHPCPTEAWCDADQALSIDEFGSLMTKLRAIAHAVGRTMPEPVVANEAFAVATG